MAITLNEQFNKGTKVGSTQWYEVKVNVESDNLDDIELVEYYLDRSVSNPIIASGNPDNKFEIQTKSWKEFPVSAKIIFKDHDISPVYLKTA
jgi:hypothetical protein